MNMFLYICIIYYIQILIECLDRKYMKKMYIVYTSFTWLVYFVIAQDKIDTQNIYVCELSIITMIEYIRFINLSELWSLTMKGGCKQLTVINVFYFIATCTEIC